MEKLLIRFCPRREPDLRIVCLPYAGGNASIYANWTSYLPDNVELVALQLPGRANRFNEKISTNMYQIINDLRVGLEEVTSSPYVLFGHSFGAKIAYELAFTIERELLPPPLHLIASACEAPHILHNKKQLHSLPDDEFVRELRKMNGTPEEILNNLSMLKLSLPIIRADFEASESYFSAGKRVSFPISVIYGSEDNDVLLEDVKGWRELSSVQVDIFKVTGDHFFVNKRPRETVDTVNKILSQYTNVYEV